MPSVVDRQVDWPHVRFGSLADICSAKSHVRFTPESRTLRGSVKMSALCANSGHSAVCY